MFSKFLKVKINLACRTSYLPVSAPFHSQVLLSDAPAAIIADLGQSAEAPWELKFPVFSTRDGSDLREKKDGLLLELLSLQVCQPLHWEKAIERALPTNSVSHVSIPCSLRLFFEEL